MQTFNCETCGQVVTAKRKDRQYFLCERCYKKQYNANHPRSPELQRKYSANYHARHSGLCEKCGSKLRTKDAKFCVTCYRAYKLWEFPKGSKHPSWKGGRHLQRGYIFVWNSKSRRLIPEHRLIWEQTHNKKLPKGWIVHHLNGIKTDNCPKNLVAIPRKKHSVWTLVNLAQARIRELEQLRLSFMNEVSPRMTSIAK